MAGYVIPRSLRRRTGSSIPVPAQVLNPTHFPLDGRD